MLLRTSEIKIRFSPRHQAICTTWGNRKPEIATFHLNAACCFASKHKTHLEYHLITVEPAFTITVIDYMQQTGPIGREHSIQQYVALDVHQVCHGVSRCVKNESCSSSNL